MILAFVLTILSYLAPVQVASFATSGNGTAASPFVGWESLPINASTEYRFSCPQSGECWFAYTNSPNWLKSGVAVIGEAGVNLKHNGYGDAFVMNAPPDYWIQNVRVENLTVWGNPNTRHGFYLSGIRNGIFSHLSVKDVAQAGMYTDRCVTNVLTNFRVTYHEPVSFYGFNVRPQYGLVVSGWSTTWAITNLVIEGVSGVGVWLKADSYGTVVNVGTSEANVGAAIGVQIDSFNNTFTGFDVEANASGEDWTINGFRNQLINCTNSSSGKTRLIGGTNKLLGGSYGHIFVNSGQNQLDNLVMQGTLTDNGFDTIKIRVNGSADAKRTTIGVVMPRLVQMDASSGVVNTDASATSFGHIVSVNNFTLANPTNPVSGQSITWRIVALTVPLTVAYGSAFAPLGAPLQTIIPAGTTIYLNGNYNAATQKWDVFQLKTL